MSLSFRNSLAVFVVAGALLVGTPLVANATTSYPAGGTWNHGVRSGGGYGSGGQVYSEYQHRSKQHHATACNADKKCKSNGWAAPGRLAAGYYSPASAGRNTAYYNVR